MHPRHSINTTSQTSRPRPNSTPTHTTPAIALERLRAFIWSALLFPFPRAATPCACTWSLLPRRCILTDHGLELQPRQLPDARSSTRSSHSRRRYGPPRYAFAGGLHQPAADTPGQSQQKPPATGRIRPSSCLRKCHETAADYRLALQAEARDTDVAEQVAAARRRRQRPIHRSCDDSDARRSHAQVQQGEHTAKRECAPGHAQGAQLPHARSPVTAGTIPHTGA